MLALIARMRVAGRERTQRGVRCGARIVSTSAGQLLLRERVALVLDPSARPSSSCSTLAGYMFDVHGMPHKSVPGGGLDRRDRLCLAALRSSVARATAASTPGAIQHMGREKLLRAQELALANKLPFVHLVESAGANLLR